MPEVVLLLGFAAGVMGVASIAGLLIPAGEEGSVLAVISGLAVGASLLGVVRWKLSPGTTFMGHADSRARTSALVFLVLFVHSICGASKFLSIGVTRYIVMHRSNRPSNTTLG